MKWKKYLNTIEEGLFNKSPEEELARTIMRMVKNMSNAKKVNPKSVARLVYERMK